MKSLFQPVFLAAGTAHGSWDCRYGIERRRSYGCGIIARFVRSTPASACTHAFRGSSPEPSFVLVTPEASIDWRFGQFELASGSFVGFRPRQHSLEANRYVPLGATGVARLCVPQIAREKGRLGSGSLQSSDPPSNKK